MFTSTMGTVATFESNFEVLGPALDIYEIPM